MAAIGVSRGSLTDGWNRLLMTVEKTTMQNATIFESLGNYSFMNSVSQQRQCRPEAITRDTYAGVVLCRNFRLFRTCGGIFGLIYSMSSRPNYLMGAISWLGFSFVSGIYLGYNVGQKM